MGFDLEEFVKKGWMPATQSIGGWLQHGLQSQLEKSRHGHAMEETAQQYGLMGEYAEQKHGYDVAMEEMRRKTDELRDVIDRNSIIFKVDQDVLREQRLNEEQLKYLTKSENIKWERQEKYVNALRGTKETDPERLLQIKVNSLLQTTNALKTIGEIERGAANELGVHQQMLQDYKEAQELISKGKKAPAHAPSSEEANISKQRVKEITTHLSQISTLRTRLSDQMDALHLLGVEEEGYVPDERQALLGRELEIVEEMLLSERGKRLEDLTDEQIMTLLQGSFAMEDEPTELSPADMAYVMALLKNRRLNKEE